MPPSTHQPIMILGTGSHCGKTTIVAGLCRFFANLGLRVAPFKSQNMALNSYVTDDDEEIARSIAVQAQGARQTPLVEMNPILLKPKSDTQCQLVINGNSIRDVSAHENFLDPALRAEKIATISRSIRKLQSKFDLIVAEGAGSCAEPNLAEVDVVNLAVAKLLGARVFVLGDIDVGGVFAQFAGTHQILDQTDPEGLGLLEGFVINKFRGDIELLQSGIDFHNQTCPRPVCGVLPMLHGLQLDQEDRTSFPRHPQATLKIAIPYLPHIANTTDFDLLAHTADVEVRLVSTADDFGQPDAVIIPGTKNTVDDLVVLRESGMEHRIQALAERIPIFGICGGFQLLGRQLNDPHHFESDRDAIDGMGLLDIDFTFEAKKAVARHTYHATEFNPFRVTSSVKGYEIHCGQPAAPSNRPMFVCESRGAEGRVDGAVHPQKPIYGSFIHDLFRDPNFCLSFLNFLRSRRGLPIGNAPLLDPRQVAEQSLDRVAEMIREHWNPTLSPES